MEKLVARQVVDTTTAEEASYVPFAQNLMFKAKQLMRHQKNKVFSRHWLFDGVNIFIRMTPWSETIRIRAGAAVIGYFYDSGLSYEWLGSGEAELIENPGTEDPQDPRRVEQISKNLKTRVWRNTDNQEREFYYSGTLIGTSTEGGLDGEEAISYDGLRMYDTGGATLTPEIRLVTISAPDEDDLRTLDEEIYVYSDQSEYSTEFNDIGQSVFWTSSNIRLFITEVSAGADYLNWWDWFRTQLPDDVHHDTHRIMLQRSYASYSISDSGDYPNFGGTSRWYNFLISETHAHVVFERNKDTGVLSQLLKVEFARTREGSAHAKSPLGTAYGMGNATVWREGSVIVDQADSRNLSAVTTTGELVSLISVVEVLGTPASEVYATYDNPSDFSRWEYPSGSSVNMRSEVHVYLGASFIGAIVLGESSKDSFNRVDAPYPRTSVNLESDEARHGGVALRNGTDPTFFLRFDLTDSNDYTMMYVSGTNSEVLDPVTYETRGYFRVSSDGRFNYREQVDGVTIDVYEHDTLITSMVVPTTGGELIPSAVNPLVIYYNDLETEDDREHFKYTLQYDTEEETWSVATTPIPWPEGFTDFYEEPHFDWLPALPNE